MLGLFVPYIYIYILNGSSILNAFILFIKINTNVMKGSTKHEHKIKKTNEYKKKVVIIFNVYFIIKILFNFNS